MKRAGKIVKRARAAKAEGVARLFMHGRSQAVRLPKAFRFPGTRVRVRRVGQGVLLEPLGLDLDAWWAGIDECVSVPFMPQGRGQPPPPPT